MLSMHEEIELDADSLCSTETRPKPTENRTVGGSTPPLATAGHGNTHMFASGTAPRCERYVSHMRRSLTLVITSGIAASLLIQSPVIGSQTAPNTRDHDELKRVSTLMLTAAEVPQSLDVDPGWRFTSTSRYPVTLHLCTTMGRAVTAPPVNEMHRVTLGASSPVGTRTALQQSMWVHSTDRAALKAWSDIKSGATECNGELSDSEIRITADHAYTLISREGSTIQSLRYEIPNDKTFSAKMRRDLESLSRELSSKWSAPEGTENFYVRSASGEELAQAFFSLLQATGTPTAELNMTKDQIRKAQADVEPFLDPAFQLVRANGQRYLEDNYVPADVDEFEIRDVVTTSPTDGVVVVRYSVRAPGETAPDAGVLLSDTWQPRISTFHWDEAANQWRLLSHANFSTPVAAICNQEQYPLTPGTPRTSAADIALGDSLVQQWRAITTGQIRMSVRHPAHQIQLADGQGWPTKDGTPIAWTPAQAYDYDNLIVTRNGNLLVLSYDAIAQDIVMEGDVYRSEASPRLMTYLLSPAGKWELISLANFTVPREIPAGVDCVSGL